MSQICTWAVVTCWCAVKGKKMHKNTARRWAQHILTRPQAGWGITGTAHTHTHTRTRTFWVCVRASSTLISTGKKQPMKLIAVYANVRVCVFYEKNRLYLLELPPPAPDWLPLKWSAFLLCVLIGCSARHFAFPPPAAHMPSLQHLRTVQVFFFFFFLPRAIWAHLLSVVQLLPSACEVTLLCK